MTCYAACLIQLSQKLILSFCDFQSNFVEKCLQSDQMNQEGDVTDDIASSSFVTMDGRSSLVFHCDTVFPQLCLYIAHQRITCTVQIVQYYNLHDVPSSHTVFFKIVRLENLNSTPVFLTCMQEL